MKRYALWIVLLLSLGVNFGVLATLAVQKLRAPAVSDRPELRGEPTFRRMVEGFDLQGEDRRRFGELQRQLFEQTRRGRREIEKVRTEIRRELTADTPDRERLERLMRRSAEITGALERALIETVLQSRELLTPEDRRRYMRFLERMRARAGR